jgi:hypothetical protein
MFVWMNGPDDMIERSTCDSAAKCTTSRTPCSSNDIAHRVRVADVGLHERQPLVLQHIIEVRQVPA